MVHELEGPQDQFLLHGITFISFQLLNMLSKKTRWLPQSLAYHLDISETSLNLDKPRDTSVSPQSFLCLSNSLSSSCFLIFQLNYVVEGDCQHKVETPHPRPSTCHPHLDYPQPHRHTSEIVSHISTQKVVDGPKQGEAKSHLH